LDSKPYLGYQIESKIVDLKTKGLLAKNEENNLREPCQCFLLAKFKQLKQRLPKNVAVLRNVSLFC
jgi:hypothetical protein